MKSNYTYILVLIISLFASCKKDETTSNPNNPNNITQSMEIIVYLNTVTDSTVELKGNIMDEGNSPVTVRGFCLTTNNITPDISNSDTFNVGSGVGFYTKTISNLIPGTTYYFRAFGINAQGTAYSDRQSFTSAEALPTVHSVSANAIDQTTANAIGEVMNDGGSPVINRGFILYYNPGGMNNNPRTINSGSGN
ncbi:MAG TPA: hypothetical protein PLU53_16180, partial [Bacteroidia bacterium]|nr:hypothetical protein [Bacteroidia bacterium]